MKEQLRTFAKSLNEVRWNLHRTEFVSNRLASRTPPGVLFLHHGRCGSTVLKRLLDQNPRLRAFGEIFDKYFKDPTSMPAPQINMLRACRTVAYPRRAIVETKFFDCQHLSIFPYGISEFLACAEKAGFNKFLFLNRKNYLHKVISGAVASARGRKFNFRADEQIPDTRIDLNVDAVGIQGKAAPIIDLFEYMDAQVDLVEEQLRGRDVIELTYEDDLENDPRRAYQKICEWIGIEPASVELNTRRARTESAKDTVKNWENIVHALTNTKYEWMLETR